MARTKKTQTTEEIPPVVHEDALGTLLTIPSNKPAEQSRFVITAKFKGLQLGEKKFDNMKVMLFECNAITAQEAKQKFVAAIGKTFTDTDPNEFITQTFGPDIYIEEYKTLNKITINF